MRFLTAGESHGVALNAILEGVPAGLRVTTEEIDAELRRRQKGFGRGPRMALESDTVEILSGVRDTLTLGTPISLLIRNRDWENWREVMEVGEHSKTSRDEEDVGAAAKRTVRVPRPGHADLVGALKYGHLDMRNVLERASARETAARVAIGAICKRLLAEVGVEIFGRTVSIGGVSDPTIPPYTNREGADSWWKRNREVLEDSSVRCIDSSSQASMISKIALAAERGDTLGGVFELIAVGVPPGLGSYVHWDRRLDARISGAVMAINGVKGVEIGFGFRNAELPGSKVHDEIGYEGFFFRHSNNAGGVEGGVSNGEPIVVRAAMKPIATLRSPLRSIDIRSKKEESAHSERSDVCAVPAACVVGEAALAWVLADAVCEKFGGDSVRELKANYESYLEWIRSV